MKPICFLDLETTGLSCENDRIVEIAIVRVDDGLETTYCKRVNPGVKIPAFASSVHGITDAMVADCQTFKAIAPEILALIDGSDIAGYNSTAYDIPLLRYELVRAGYVWKLDGVNFIDVCNIFKRKEGRGLAEAVRFYLDKEHEGAHGALADVQATIAVLAAQRERYTDLPGTHEELALFSNYDKPRERTADIAGKFIYDKKGDVVFNFGQHRGKKAKTERSYLQWMLTSDFPEDTKAIIREVLSQTNHSH